MRVSLKKWLLAEPQIRGAGFRYGLFALIFAVFFLQFLAWPQMSATHRPDRYFGLIVPLMLLLNHLAYQFRWSQPVTIVLRVVAWIWIVFGLSFMTLVICKR